MPPIQKTIVQKSAVDRTKIKPCWQTELNEIFLHDEEMYYRTVDRPDDDTVYAIRIGRTSTKGLIYLGVSEDTNFNPYCDVVVINN